MSVTRIRYTHDAALDEITHGRHAGRTVTSIADDLMAGSTAPTFAGMILDLVFWHGAFLSLF